jgi:protein-tyrosine phosphatase
MIDLHFHCLPGIDDGPDDWIEAVELCQAAAAEGTRTIVATPHVLRGGWVNDDPDVRDGLVLHLNTLLGGEPKVLAGCEYFLSPEAPDLLEMGRWSPLTGLNRTRFLLVELPSGEIPAKTGSIFHELELLGVTPVLAHPERNRELVESPSKLGALVGRGALTQITAGSLLGDFGAAALAACQEFFRLGLVNLVASDAHSLDRRPPRLAAARKEVRGTWGEDAEYGLFEANPRALLLSETPPWPGRPGD